MFKNPLTVAAHFRMGYRFDVHGALSVEVVLWDPARPETEHVMALATARPAPAPALAAAVVADNAAAAAGMQGGGLLQVLMEAAAAAPDLEE